MTEALGAVLPSALGVVISPVPVIAVVLMLMSPRAGATGTGFLVGWLGGIAGATALVWSLAAVLPDSSQGDSSFAWVLRAVLGALLIVLAVRNFRASSGPDDLPGWLAAVDTMSGGRAFVLGAALSALNPKNVVMIVAAVGGVADSGVSRVEALVVLGVFVLLAGTSVALPVLAHAVAPQQVGAPLSRLKECLVLHHSSVMGTLLLVLGVVLVGQGMQTAP